MIDLHIHLGGAVPSAVLWEILCDNGLQVEFKDFDSFHESLTVDAGTVRSLDDFLGRYFSVTELIQSSPTAASTSAYQLVAKAYRRARAEAVEMRFNPLKRMRGSVHTLEAIILATVQGLERASMHYKMKTGIILSMGRDLSLEANWEIAEAACAWASRGPRHGAWGVVGVDVAGPESPRKEFLDPWMSEMAAIMQKCRNHGLGVTWHIGETAATGPEGICRVLERVRPHRIGHGIEVRKASGKVGDRLFSLLKETGCHLEVCPSVNVVTHSVKGYGELGEALKTCHRVGIPFNLNTDNPYLIHTNLQREYALMKKALGVDADAVLADCHTAAAQASFLKDF